MTDSMTVVSLNNEELCDCHARERLEEDDLHRLRDGGCKGRALSFHWEKHRDHIGLSWENTRDLEELARTTVDHDNSPETSNPVKFISYCQHCKKSKVEVVPMVLQSQKSLESILSEDSGYKSDSFLRMLSTTSSGTNDSMESTEEVEYVNEPIFRTTLTMIEKTEVHFEPHFDPTEKNSPFKPQDKLLEPQDEIDAPSEPEIKSVATSWRVDTYSEHSFSS